MRRTTRRAVTAAAVAVVIAIPLAVTSVATSSAAAPSGGTRITVHKVGTAKVAGNHGLTQEFGPAAAEGQLDVGKAVANRSPKSRAKALRVVTGPSGVTPTKTLTASTSAAGYEGINQFQQRYTDDGNQWTVTPPDQALCASPTQVLEGVNVGLQVFDATKPTKVALTGTLSINRMLWGDSEIDRATGIQSPHQMGDPSCVYDAGTKRFFLTVYDLDTDPVTGALSGRSWTDIAVSPEGTAIGTWTVFQVNGTNDGSDGTPVHPNCPCFGDYPHIATDKNGFYLSTNEYPTLVDGWNGAMVYAIDKAALVAGSTTPNAVMFDTHGLDLNNGNYYSGFTIAPAISAGAGYSAGTQYFLSSDGNGDETAPGSHQVLLWSIANTGAIASSPSSLRLDKVTVPSQFYTAPPASNQKAGSVPLATCLNTTACAKSVLGTPDKFKEYEFAFDSGDSRMLQAAYANGKVWGALTTAVDVGGATKAGVAYFVVNPSTGTIARQGVLAVAGNNITYPALGVTSAGKAVMAMSLAGADYYPSAAYVKFGTDASTVSNLTVVGPGAGPDDDFSGYRGFQYNFPRWGDYGAAAVVGTTVWIASEYVAQTCTYAEYVASSFRCNDTRSALANWSTHVTAVPAG
jgi:hypothetical protein